MEISRISMIGNPPIWAELGMGTAQGVKDCTVPEDDRRGIQGTRDDPRSL
jgi:hypothetical protein